MKYDSQSGRASSISSGEGMARIQGSLTLCFPPWLRVENGFSNGNTDGTDGTDRFSSLVPCGPCRPCSWRGPTSRRVVVERLLRVEEREVRGLARLVAALLVRVEPARDGLRGCLEERAV